MKYKIELASNGVQWYVWELWEGDYQIDKVFYKQRDCINYVAKKEYDAKPY